MSNIIPQKNRNSRRMPYQEKSRRKKRKYLLFPALVVATIIALLLIMIGTGLLAGITYALHLEAENTSVYPAVIYGLAFFIGAFLITVFTKAKSYWPVFAFSLEFVCISLLVTWSNDLPITVTAAVKMIAFIFILGMLAHICAFMMTPKKKKTARARANNTPSTPSATYSRYDLSKYNLDI